MNLRVNSCQIYLFLILILAFNGTLYEGGGIIAQGLQFVFFLISIFYAFYANSKYKLPLYFKVLNVLLIMFTVYGVLLVLSGERYILEYTFEEVSNTSYLKNIYRSLLPVYAFYVFTKQGLLKETTVKIWFFVFFALTIYGYVDEQTKSLKNAIEMGLYSEGFTLNIGYTFLSLIPALVLFNQKPKIQFIGIVLIFLFIVIAMKRGAILIGVICLIWFLKSKFKMAQKKTRRRIVAAGVVFVLLGIILFNYMMETNEFFRFRVAQTEERYASGREDLYKTFYNQFIHEKNTFRFLFGYGANATLKIAGNYAHNDWLEIAIDNGLFGVIVYLFYWVGFFITWRKTKHNPQSFQAVGMIFMIYFLSTLFSMSFACVSSCAAMTLGYFLAVSKDNQYVLDGGKSQG